MQAVQPVLGGGGQVGELNLELIDLTHAQRHDQQDQAGHHDDDRDKDQNDREDAGNAGRVKARHGGLDEECDRRSKNESSKKVAEEEEDDDRHDESRNAKGDLQVAPAPLRIERPRRGRDPADRGRTLEFSLVGRSGLRVRTHVTQSSAV